VKRFSFTYIKNSRRWNLCDLDEKLKDSIWIQQSTHSAKYLVYLNGKVEHRTNFLTYAKEAAEAIAYRVLRGKQP
jgi:hypothetical protein